MLWILTLLIVIGALSYHRAALSIWGISLTLFLVFLSSLSHASWFSLIITWGSFLGLFALFAIASIRKKWLSKPVLKLYQKLMPTMSRTEREALSAGTVGWEGDLFSGAPRWLRLLAIPKPELSVEEKAFIDGPVETLCAMIDDWDITHNRADLPKEVWDYIKKEGFFSLIIPKQYGGKAFSAYAHSQILIKLYTRSAAVGSTVSVPNSLGPAELLLKYGTEEQKNYYLPRLAAGDDIPCFALTGPDAGSDASAMPDNGVICFGDFEGKNVLGIRLNFNKRYITLAPVATVIGLAFKLYDPDHLLGKKTDLGITCALIPRNTVGVTIGRRHFPSNIVFQNGPIQGKDVFIPVNWIIGGTAMAGRGWQMLMECLAAGRAISLPSGATAAAKASLFASGGYAHIRRQFNLPIGRFEGIEAVLGRMAGHTYLMDATRSFTLSVLDKGEHPSVASGIVKSHVTELGRKVVMDAMDVHGGKGICLGPKNYLADFFHAMPIAITVEGANILTRNMIIFGQGVMRCHPYIFAENAAAQMQDPQESLQAFDKALKGHLAFVLSNFVRTVTLGLTAGLIAHVPSGKDNRYFRYATRFSAAFAFLMDVLLLTYGGGLKRKESVSARMGDIVSYLYMVSSVLKHHRDQGQPLDDLPIVYWVCQTCFYQIQQTLDEVLKNFPNRFLAGLLRIIIFPLGKHFSKPSDALTFQVAQLMMSSTPSRYRLSSGTYVTPVDNNMFAIVEDALLKVIAAEPVVKSLKEMVRNDLIAGGSLTNQAKAAHDKGLISADDFQLVSVADVARAKVIAVDDFAPAELGRLSGIAK